MIKYNNRIKALSLFANVGVAETYFRELGIDVLLANELVEREQVFIDICTQRLK